MAKSQRDRRTDFIGFERFLSEVVEGRMEILSPFDFNLLLSLSLSLSLSLFVSFFLSFFLYHSLLSSISIFVDVSFILVHFLLKCGFPGLFFDILTVSRRSIFGDRWD